MVLLSLIGCETPPRTLEPPELRDDLGVPLERQPINEETVGETQMLHRRTQIDVHGGVSIPTGFFQSNDFDPGPTAGTKLSIETAKNLFVGISFDWSQWKQGNGIDSLTGGSASGLASARPDQLYDKLDKYDFMLNVDYDLTLTKSFIVEKKPLLLRMGLGVGGTLIEGSPDKFLEQSASAAGQNLDIQPFVGFIARLGLGLRWQVHQNIILFTDASYEFVAPFQMEISVNGQRSTVDGDIDFGSGTIGFGIAFEF